MRREFWAISLAILFMAQSWAINGNELSEAETYNSYNETQLFNQSGFYEDGVYTTSDGESHVSKPTIQWTAPGNLLLVSRTGACSVAIDSLDEVWLMGGRIDPNPSQNNDETPTEIIEKLSNHNKTWQPADLNMPNEQQYCEAEVVGDLVFVIGDWFRNSNPAQLPTGTVQIFNLTNETWYEGTPMPSSHERGLGGMAEANGYLFYAGGVRNPSGTDATNKTFRYDPINDSWARMADMNQPRASFELINFHGQLYAIGGFQGTQTWNRQGLDYVERYDPATDTWTNLSAIPKAMFGWGGTVHNDEIVLVGGFNNGPQKSVFQWNPIDDTWIVGNDIGTPGHFDLEVESINGSIVWASGDMATTYPYTSWQTSYSIDTEYQNQSESHSGWITSPVLDLRPNPNGKAIPTQFELQGTNTPGGEIGFQYRASSTPTTLPTQDWLGPDGTANTTFPVGITNLNLTDYANFLQYRIKMTVTDMSNWDEPNLDSMAVIAEHAAFVNIPPVVHPRGETVTIRTSHDISTSGEMYLDLAPCDSSGALHSQWSRLSHDGNTFTENDTMDIFISSSGSINSSSNGETIIDWSFDLGDISSSFIALDLCAKVGSTGAKNVEYIHPTTIKIDRSIHVNITGVQGHSIGDSITDEDTLQIRLNHSFPSTGMTISSGDILARMSFDIRVFDSELNAYTGWVNQTTPWMNLTAGHEDTITWTPPSNISGMIDISVEARNDTFISGNRIFEVFSNSNSWWLLLDNDNPSIIYSDPVDGSYIDSMENREISIMVADTSGFDSENISLEVWVQGIHDTSADGTPQISEYETLNHTLENDGSLWWLNATQSDDMNSDDERVYLRIVGSDKVGAVLENNTIWWSTRNAQNAVIESISNNNQSQNWEVSRDISWQVVVSDANSIFDIINLRMELGGDSDFGIIYNFADSSCSVLDSRIDSDRTTCSHSLDGEQMIFAVTLFSGWEVDLSVLNEGVIDIKVEDKDGFSTVNYQNMWYFSQDFDFEIDGITDISQPVTGTITNESILITQELISITGWMNHSLSGTPYQGELSVRWWGLLQGESWYGSSTINVENGVINATIPMPSTGGILDISVSFMDPWETIVIKSHQLPIFIVDDEAPVILQSNVEEISRFHLDDVGIGVNIVEDVGWTGELQLTCQVSSTNLQWPEIVISKTPSSYYQDRTLFSFYFDFSKQGDPTLLSPEAEINCWAAGYDDSGLELVGFGGMSLTEPWMTIPLSAIGPNIELVDVKLDGQIEPGNEIKVEITVKNTGESLDEQFNITVYTIVDNERTLVGKYSQANIASGKGIIKRVAIIVPEGDWTLEVNVDEEQNIWELDEDDNSFSKDYSAPEEIDYMLYWGIALGATVLFVVAVILKKRSKDEFSEVKKMPSIEDLPRSSSGDVRPKSSSFKPKRGPPPKKTPEVKAEVTTPDISTAMAALSLDTLPGGQSSKIESVDSYESLPGGGEYEYLGEGTFYSGEGIGKWKLEENGSFTKIE